jgi:glycine cleavage system aminomethyltransferase T
MAIVRADLATPGATLDVAFGDGSVPAAVDALPLYDTQKTRPRS